MIRTKHTISVNSCLSSTFILLVAFIFLGPDPLVVFSSTDLADDSDDGLVRRAVLLGLMVFSAALAWRKAGIRPLLDFPVPLALFLAWAGFTLAWSDVFLIGFRRYVLAAGITISLFMLLRAMGANRIVSLLYKLVFFFLVIDLISVALLPGAVHGPVSADQALVGLWKGVHPHKNIAASVAFCGVALSLSGVVTGRWRNGILFILAALVAYGAGSKTVLILIPVVYFICRLYLFTRTKGILSRHGAMALASLAVLCTTFLLHEYWLQLFPVITDPKFFTGRGVLWDATLSYSFDHPWGAGFGSFWDLGRESPATQYIAAQQAEAPHGHNGYFDILATTGFIGLALALLSCLLHPLVLMARANSREPNYFFAILIFSFFVAGNVTESNLLSGGRIDWLLFLIAMVIFIELQNTKSKAYD